MSHSTNWSSGASWLRPPSSWTKARATRRYVGGGPGDVLPSHCPHHFERCAMQSHVVALDFSLLFDYLFLAPEGTVSVCHRGITLCSSSLGHDLRSYHVPEKDASLKCLGDVLGKLHLPCWRFIVVRNGPSVVFIFSF